MHCHTFNGDDLPVRGFIAHVALHDAALGSVLARLLDATVQGEAPGYASERARLDALLGAPQMQEMFGLGAAPTEPQPDPEQAFVLTSEQFVANPVNSGVYYSERLVAPSLFASDRGGSGDIWVMISDGSRPFQVTTDPRVRSGHLS